MVGSTSQVYSIWVWYLKIGISLISLFSWSSNNGENIWTYWNMMFSNHQILGIQRLDKPTVWTILMVARNAGLWLSGDGSNHWVNESYPCHFGLAQPCSFCILDREYWWRGMCAKGIASVWYVWNWFQHMDKRYAPSCWFVCLFFVCFFWVCVCVLSCSCLYVNTYSKASLWWVVFRVWIAAQVWDFENLHSRGNSSKARSP